MLPFLSRIRRPLAFALILLAVAGLALTIYGAVELDRANRALAAQTDPAINRLLGLVGDARTALAAYQSAMSETTATLATLETTSGSAAETLVITDRVLASITTLLEDDLPRVLANTDTALESAGRSAGVVDFFLKGMNTIAQLTGLRYEPAVPLGEAIDGVQASLTPMEESLAAVAEDLTNARRELDPIRTDLLSIRGGLAEMGAALEDGQSALAGYDDLLTEMETTLQAAAEAAPRLRARVVALAAAVLAWLGITQLLLLFQGLHLLAHDPYTLETRLAALEARLRPTRKPE